MEKAYDTKVLVAKLKAKGLDIAEDVAAVALVEILDWVVESAKASNNSYDDLFIAVMPLLKAEMLKQIDKIDGKQG